ncbi:MAG TPA: 16S rRNA (guanine(966)-N(2))-methyltransferase RsmD [Tepidisphaeraceae bacterium]|jgi:16S rRNA (guanine966-N2)-methyltransferase
MRIIAGEHRGRKLLPPESETTRPITDRVKQSLFDILTPWMDGAVVLDLFSGTGSMGLECLSRGAAYATFFELDRSAVIRLNKNIDTLKVRDRAKVVSSDLFRYFATAPAKADANLIFLDPPYRFLRQRPDDLRKLALQLAQQLAPEGIVIFRHDAADELALPPLVEAEQRNYGSMTIDLLRAPTPA